MFARSFFVKRTSVQDTHTPSTVYALPSMVVLQSPELRDVIRWVVNSTRVRPQDGMFEPSEDIIDDSMLAEEADWIRKNSCQTLCFRVLDLNPAAQKLLKPNGCLLRQDHVAIVPYTVTSKSAASRELTIQNSVFSDGDIGARVISLETFLKMKCEQILKTFTKQQVKEEAQYELDFSDKRLAQGPGGELQHRRPLLSLYHIREQS